MYRNRGWCRAVRACRLSTVAEQAAASKQTGVESASRPLPPPRILRGPTDLLQALASTVGTDPTAAHYKYHDDPFLTPLSNFRKRSHALAQEAGRKAAVWIRDEHTEWFTTRVWDPPTKLQTEHYNADPRITAYAPKPIYNDESKVTQEDLAYVIDNALVEDAVKVFQLIGGVSGAGEENARALMQLLCFYNEREPDSAEWLEERWFASGAGRDRRVSTWKTGGLAEEIFNSLQEKDSAAYCTIIQGMAKYYQAERAYQLSRDALEAGAALSADTYHALLGCTGFLREGNELRTQLLLQLLKEMDQQGIWCSEQTLSACLGAVSAWGGGRLLRQLSLQLLAEFRSLGVRPTLTEYYHLLCIFCKERGPKTDILTSILNDLEKRDKLEAREPTDTHFFVTALGLCNEHLQDMALAERVHALLMKGDNYKLLGDAFKESIYYRHLVTVACRRATLERATQLLDELVPNVYVPEPSVMEEIIKCLELGGAGERLAQAWSQLVVFGHARRTRLLERLLAAMCSCYQHQEEEVRVKMRAAAVEMLHFGDNQEEANDKDMRTPPPKLSASALAHIIELCSEAGDAAEAGWAAAAEAARRLRAGAAAGVPWSPRPLLALADRAVALGQHSIAATALSYAAECGWVEAREACVRALAAALNRPDAEVRRLLSEPRAHLQHSLDPALLAIVDAHNLSGTAESLERESEQTSSMSDSDTSDSERENK